MVTRLNRLSRHFPINADSADSIPAKRSTLLYDLLASSLVLAEDWEQLDEIAKERILRSPHDDQLLSQLVEQGLLTMYQAARISAGTAFGLILGNYRVLDRLGAGGMAVVFKAEHIHLRHAVAIKVMPQTPDQDHCLLTRFFSEMRAVAQLRHPNIVTAIDAGKVESDDPDTPELRYFVMDYVPGQDLEEYVEIQGPLSHPRACSIAYQIASALNETHKFGLVHRDIKPSNILITSEGQAKLLDFGLMRQLNTRLTQPGAVLGTLDYMAPEQAQDASTVDIRADLYGLGGTLYWCLTGKLPFPPCTSPSETLIRRLTQRPPSPREHAPDVPAELEAVLFRLMATNPEDRYPSPQAAMQALLPFLKAEDSLLADGSRSGPPFLLQPSKSARQVLEQFRTDHEGSSPTLHTASSSTYRILLVDDEPGLRTLCREVLKGEGVTCDEAADGPEALAAVEATPYDLVLLDIRMPSMLGVEVLRRLRESPPCPHLKVIMCSGETSPDEMAQMLQAGADDYLTKPFSIIQLQARVKAALRLKSAQDRSVGLTNQLLAVNTQLEQNLGLRDSDLTRARNALVLALAKLVEQRDSEIGGHVQRMQRYCRCLAEEAIRVVPFSEQIDRPFIELLECCAPLHDIGKVGLPDHILLKPGRLEADERILMQAHTIMGAETLRQVAQKEGFSPDFLQMAIDIARHHHERFDGTGYPDRLAGTSIPLAARLVALADTYDALRSRRVYKPALSHRAAVQVMTEADPGHFDPALLQVFARCAAAFEKIYKESPG